MRQAPWQKQWLVNVITCDEASGGLEKEEREQRSRGGACTGDAGACGLKVHAEQVLKGLARRGSRAEKPSWRRRRRRRMGSSSSSVKKITGLIGLGS